MIFVNDDLFVEYCVSSVSTSCEYSIVQGLDFEEFSRADGCFHGRNWKAQGTLLESGTTRYCLLVAEVGSGDRIEGNDSVTAHVRTRLGLC